MEGYGRAVVGQGLDGGRAVSVWVHMGSGCLEWAAKTWLAVAVWRAVDMQVQASAGV